MWVVRGNLLVVLVAGQELVYWIIGKRQQDFENNHLWFISENIWDHEKGMAVTLYIIKHFKDVVLDFTII